MSDLPDQERFNGPHPEKAENVAYSASSFPKENEPNREQLQSRVGELFTAI